MTDIENRSNGLTASDLRQKLQAHLRSNGSLGQLKSQLRSMILNEVIQVKSDVNSAHRAADHSHALADAFVYEHLHATDRRYSLSVFSSEASHGIPVGAAEADHLRSLFTLPNANQSVLEQLIGTVNHLQRTKTSATEISTQTAPQEAPTLEQRLALVDSQFASKHQNRLDLTRAEFEMKLGEYRQEIEQQLRLDMKREVESFRAKELAEARLAEELKYKNLLKCRDSEFQEMERSIERKAQLQLQRVESLKQELELQRVALEKRQKDVLSIVNERDEQILLLEQTSADVKQRLRHAQALVAQYEEAAATNLMDLERARVREQRRMEDLRRVQGDHMIELRLRDEEISDLQRRVRLQPAVSSDEAAVAATTVVPQPLPVPFPQQQSGGTPSAKPKASTSLQLQLSPAAAAKTQVKPTNHASEPTTIKPLPIAGSVPEPLVLVTPRPTAVPVAANAAAAGSTSALTMGTPPSSISSPPHHQENPNNNNMSLSTIANNATLNHTKQEIPHPQHHDSSSSTNTTATSESFASSTSISSKHSLSPASLDQEQDNERQLQLQRLRQEELEESEHTIRQSTIVSNEEKERQTLKETFQAGLVCIPEETAARKKITATSESDFATLKWSAKNEHDAVRARDEAKLVGRYGVHNNAEPRFEAPVVIHRDSDDSGDDMLFGKKSSDDDDSDF